MAAASLMLGIWAPSAGAATLHWPSLSVTGLRTWLTASKSPAKAPGQALGSADGRTHQVPASVTRTQRKGAGTAPGTGRGQLPAYPPHAPSRPSVTSGPDVFASGFNAATSHLLPSDSTATEDVYQNANGTITRDVYAGPVNYQTSSGSYAPIDTTLASAGGRWKEKANSLGVSFAPTSGAPVLGSMDLGGGESYGFGLAGAAAVTATQNGSSVVYPGVLPDTDLLETAGPAGLTETLMLHSAAASAAWVFPLTLKGLAPIVNADGSVSLVSAAGTTAVSIPAGQAWDSKSAGQAGQPADVVPTTWQLVTYNGGPALQLSLPPGWLTSPDRVFPVTVDPSGNEGVTGTTFVQTGDSNANHSTNDLMSMGTYDGGTDRARTFLNFGNLGDVGRKDLQNYHVTAATLAVWDSWAYICSTAERFDVFAILSSWSLTSMTYGGPSTGRIAGSLAVNAPSAACTDNNVPGYAPYPDPYDGGWMDVPLNSIALTNIQNWTLGNTTNYGLSLRADSETVSYEWKKFDGYNSPHPPYLSLTYAADVAPEITRTSPPSNYNATSLTPVLQAAGTDADSWPDGLGYYFEVRNSAGTIVANSTMSASAGSAPGAVPSCTQSETGWLSAPDWTVPENELTWGQVYYWDVVDCDGLEEGISQPEYFTTQVPQPTVGQATQNSGAQGVRPGGSDYTTSATDAQESTVGPSLSIERDYDSDNFSSAGAFGDGWSSILDMKVTPGVIDAAGNTDTVMVTYPDGSQVGFGKNYNGSFTAPEGRFATLSSVSTGGYTLTDKNDTVYSFTQLLSAPNAPGTYGITSITDALGNKLNFTWTSGQISQMTSIASGRSLFITWATPSGATYAHVATVYTPPVTGTDQSTDLRWEYNYSGDELTSVCPPINWSRCTTYSYTAGTDYPDALLATSPQSYWRLDDASGPLASNSVLTSQADLATYANVTPVQPGPLPGSTATAAAFNGSSSYMSLPAQTTVPSGNQSVSLWFKTTTAGGVLLSASDAAINAGPASYYNPVLYVDTNGDLEAEFWNGSVDPIVTSKAVDDGQWHNAVLISGTNTQSLYLDGTLIGQQAGAPVPPSQQPNEYVGTGFIGSAWPNEPNYNAAGAPWYFTGSIADVGLYDRPLAPAEVAGLHQAGFTSAEQLSQITRPSGSVYSQVAYSTVTGAVTQVTDDNGGVWKITAPTVNGSSQVYVSAVLAQNPADYWRLGDGVGATAINQVNGGTATYNNVSDAQGPFADSSAGSFDGSTSYAALPNDLMPQAGKQSVSLWFRTTPGTTTTGGVLLSSSGSALSDGSTTGNYTPMLYIDSNGDLEANFWDGKCDAVATTTPVGDGAWHNVVLTSDGSGGQVLYVDGSQVGSRSGTFSALSQPNVYLGTGFVGGCWPHEPNSGNAATPEYFKGSISDVAVYDSGLSAAQVQEEWNAVTQAGTGANITPVITQTVTDPGGQTVSYEMDPLNGDRLIAQTDALGNKTKFAYDTSGYLYGVTDPNGNVTLTGHDARGNVVSKTTCQDFATQSCSTEYMTYYPDDTSTSLNTSDPLNDLMLTDRGPGSASASDPAYLTTYTYTSLGEVATETGPPVPGFAQGRTTTYAYSTSSTPAYSSSGQQSGVTPPGLLLTTTTPGGAITSTEYYSDGDVYQVTDPDGMRTTYTYDGIGRVLTKTVYSTSYPGGLATTYGYDKMGQVVSETDPSVTDPVPGTPHAAQISTTYDPDGDVLSQTVADVTPASQGGDPARTVTETYNSHDQLASSTDGVGNTTKYTYDAYGNRSSQTDPAGNTIDYTYDPDGDVLSQVLASYQGSATGSCQAVSGGLLESARTYDPGGRLASITNANCDTTAYTYTDNGLVSTITRCSQWDGTTCGGSSYVEQASTYNAADQLIAQVTNNGQTTTDYSPDAAGRNESQTLDPSGLDRTTTYSYSPDDAVLTQSVSGSTGGPASLMGYTYDPMGNMTSETVHDDTQALAPSGWWPLSPPSGSPAGSSAETYASDQSGTGNTGILNAGASWAPGGGVALDGSTGAVATSGPAVNTSGSYAVSAWVKLNSVTAGNQTVLSQDGTSNGGFYLMYNTYYGNGWSLAFANSDTTGSAVTGVWGPAGQAGTWTYLTGVYNAASHTATLYVNGTSAGTISYTGWNATGPFTVGRGLFQGSDADYLDGTVANVQAYPYALSASQVSQLYSAGQNGSALGEQQTTNWTLDSRGLPTSMTDPNGNTTSYVYDQAGQRASTTDPVVTTDVHGVGPLAVAPVSSTGYNTFGEPVVTKDPNGNEVFTSYDNNGRAVSVTEPGYTPPDGSGAIANAQATTTYNSLGEVASQTDPLGNVTSYTYDQLGDVTSKTTPAGTTAYTYDGNGDQLSATSPTGAVTDATYDFLGRQITASQVERYPSAASFTTASSYGGNGGSPWVTSATTPDGSVTSYTHDAAGEQSSVTDGAGNTTIYGYDAAGRLTRTTNPDGTYTTTSYDEAGNPTGTSDYSSAGSLLRSASASYDANGNQLTATDYRGNTTSYSYNAQNALTSEVQPVTSTSSVTTSFGYDAAGNPTLYTDGNGSNWWTTYNSWNLPESRIEPTTAAAATAADSTFTTSYNADGNPAQVSEPGGITVTDSYNSLQELTGQSGTGASATTASRSFGYNANGQLTSASAPGGTDSFTYNDRGQVLSASGPSGTSSFAFNGDGLMSSVSDAAGTTSYAYDNADRLATLSDPATGTTLSYAYNPESQVSQISYGSGGDVQLYGYNSLHQLTSDTLQTGSGQAVASISYGYDANGNLTSKSTSGFGGTASNSYTYNDANQLTSWNNGTTTTSYAYDGAGNRTQVGSKTYAYDARDELTSDGTSTYSYTMAGNLASVAGTSGTTNYTSDAFGQTITAAGQTYAYDALGRVVTDTAGSGGSGFTFSYDGTSQTLASDGANTYTWDPSGTSLIGAGVAGGTPSEGVLALTDAHTDVVGNFAASGSSLTSSAVFDPLGNVLSSGTMAGLLGYQSAWTDPSTSQAHMGARWYNPATGQFTSRDSVSVNPVPDSAAANPFAYVADNPMTGTDPTGHMLVAMTNGGAGGWPAPRPAPRPAPPRPSCSGFWGCAWHDATSVYHATVHAAVHVYHAGVQVIHAAGDLVAEEYKYTHEAMLLALAAAQQVAGHVAHALATAVADAAAPAVRVVHQAWHAVASATAAGYHAVTRTAEQAYHATVQVIHTAAHDVARAASATVSFVKNHAAAIGGFVASAAVFVGCEAALGAATGGIGAVAGAPECGALAGAAGNAVSYGITAAQTGKFSWSAFAKTTVTGAAVGYLTGGLTMGAGAELGDAASSLLAEGVATDTTEEATVAAARGAVNDGAAASADSTDLNALSDHGGEEPGGTAAEQESNVCTVGGQSFTARTKVLTATGSLVAISNLHVGQKVLATNTKTGKTTAETIAAVLVHHDTNKYDLKVGAGGKTTVIQTTSSHLFWNAGAHRWVKAAALKYGSHLRTPSGETASALGGWTPRQATGWMWDLTIPGDHDFYIQAATTTILVHNCSVNARWKVGDDYSAPTAAGNDPAWSTQRARFWKNEAAEPMAGDQYGAENIARMQRGLAPQRPSPWDETQMESMELSHEPIPARAGGSVVTPRWPDEHALFDPYRKYP